MGVMETVNRIPECQWHVRCYHITIYLIMSSEILQKEIEVYNFLCYWAHHKYLFLLDF